MSVPLPGSLGLGPMLSVKLPRSSYTPETRIANFSPSGTLTAAVVRYQS